MQLHPGPFEKMKSGLKKSELRLNDEKRQQVKIGDYIEFTSRSDSSQKILTAVNYLKMYPTFHELFLGVQADYPTWEEEDFIKSMYEYYSLEEEATYGALEIGVELVTSNPSTICPECGSPSADNLTCWDMLGIICSWEWSDSELQKEHFLTVASYNLQHPAQFEEKALSQLRTALAEYLDHGVSPSELRRRASTAFEGSRKVLKKETDRITHLTQWPMTISAVYAEGNARGAAERVRDWGKSIRENGM